jgi:16S rRNA (cytosine967-C5)-methyltransferase
VTPAARVQAAIELLDMVIEAARSAGAAADVLVPRYFKDRRYAGAADRRAVRELVFRVIRASGERPVSGRAAMIGYAQSFDPALLDLFGDGAHAPPPLDDREPVAQPGQAPRWLMEKLESRFGQETVAEVEALLARAPVDLRVNRLKASVEDVARLLPDAAPTPLARDGLRLATDFRIEREDVYGRGLVEVQDEGSQLVAGACDARPGMIVVDLCAGAGGKTLALAQHMENRGRIVACDSDRGRLSQLAPRAERAGIMIAETRLLDPGREAERLADLVGAADLVLVDAPCSGTGTWRRNPEARWRLTPERLGRLTSLQGRLLDVGAALVRPGGGLAYSICSLLREEGEDVVGAFMSRHPNWKVVPVRDPKGGELQPQLLLTPRRHGTDGFFMAVLSPILADRHD